MAESERRVSAIHQSLTQPILLAGAERPLAIANWITAAALILGGGLHWYTIAMGAFLLTIGIGRSCRSRNSIPNSVGSMSGMCATRTSIRLAPQLLRRRRESDRPCRHRRRSTPNGGEVGICLSKSLKI